jgi:hypothetical protein
MHLRMLLCLIFCVAAAGCGTNANRCTSGYHQQGTLCMPNLQ